MESHADLLQQPADAEVPARNLDAIVVPTIKPHSLQAAVKLASNTGCALVVICTTPEQARQVLSLHESATDDMLVTYLPESVEDTLLPFATSVHPQNDIEHSCHVDIARKRNVGLLLARLCGWRTIMFLDDDIRGLTEPAISRAAALTARFQAVGFEISYYPDNSVVCHAHRLAGGKQGTFPGGSALLIDVERCTTMFPPIYNEDWLFLFDAIQGRSFARAGSLLQFEYDPFAHSKRATTEEFGDVIAEGLFRLLHQGADVTGATPVYWHSVLERRFQLIDNIATRLLASDVGARESGYALMSLAAARKRLDAITPLSCASFIRAWRLDLDAWRRTLLDLPVVGDLADAAKRLELPPQEKFL